ncbi:hypothetical protein [uncultured Clostridium sp.]|uniref:hypothetical protein n=1 Tax=uncultured Clostridium sp. TaxID=59620 RepID=UPI0025DFCE67|nr:hypothetical protein [uncultured Clostridium sp.]
MKFYDKFLNLFGKECVVSDEIKLDKSTLDLDHMINEGDLIQIPLKLKLDDLKNCYDLVSHTNESADLSEWEDEIWCDDYDEEKPFISLYIDFEQLFCEDGGIQVAINIIPPVRTQEEIDEEVQREKESELHSIIGYDSYKVCECDGNAVYYWEELRDRLMDEKEWRDKHSDKDGRYSFYQVEDLNDTLKFLLSVPEIKAAYEAFNNAFPVREDA